jgi:hypothetical protein
MALRAATTLGLLLPPPSQHERITRICERSSSSSSSSSSRFSYVCRRAPSRALAVDRTSSSSSSSARTSTNITATGKLVESEKNEIKKKKKKEEEERENRNGALSTTTTLERNEDNRLPGLMNVESFAKDTITSDVVSVHDYMEQVRVSFVRSFVRVCVCVSVCSFMAVCREARIPLCDDDERIGFSFGILDSQGVDVSLFRVCGIQVPFFLGDDGGPPRWFCPVFCSPLTDDAPLLLFLPGNVHHT